MRDGLLPFLEFVGLLLCDIMGTIADKWSLGSLVAAVNLNEIWFLHLYDMGHPTYFATLALWIDDL